MIDQNSKLFLRVIRDFFKEKSSELDNEKDTAAQMILARRQQLSSMFYFQTHMPEFQQAFAATSYFYINRKKLLEKIDNAFHDSNIPYLLFKGTEIARYYPVPASRSMGDSDILVHNIDKEKAHDVLISLGFTNQKQGNMEWVYYKNDIQFELHNRLLYDEVVNEKHLKEWTDTVWYYAKTTDGIRYTLELEYHLVYLIIHLRKHFLNSGVGFRQFIDLAIVAKQKLDWERVRKYLDDIYLTTFAKTCYALIERWFDVTTPITGTISDDFYESATEKIFANGVFGFNDETNKLNRVSNSKRKRGKLGHLIGSFFPSYMNMCEAESYRFLQGKPFLLPFAWIYRWFYVVVKRKVKNGMNEAVKPYTMKDQIAERDEMLKRWGL